MSVTGGRGNRQQAPGNDARVARGSSLGQRRGREAGPEAGGGAVAPPGPKGPSPRHYADTISTAPDLRVSRRDDRYARLQLLWSVSSLPRVRGCRRKRIKPEVKILDNVGVAHYSGLQTCGSVHSCPCCGPNILNVRAEHIAAAAGLWMKMGNSVWMATFTAPHDMGMRLGDKKQFQVKENGDQVLDLHGKPVPALDGKGKPVLHRGLYSTITGSFTKILGGNRWYAVKKAANVEFNVRALEVTHGENGWHPHLHVLFFLVGCPDAIQLGKFVRHLRETWEKEIVKAGFRPPSAAHGVVVESCRSGEQAGKYIAKTQEGRSVGNELARGDMKTGKDGHRTPLEILGDFMETGDKDDLRLWNEFEQASKGRKAITGLQHVARLLGSEEVEMTDEEIAAAEVGGEEVITITADVWYRVTCVPGLPARLLSAAEKGGQRAVQRALEEAGVLDPPGFTAPPATEGFEKRAADADWARFGG